MKDVSDNSRLLLYKIVVTWMLSNMGNNCIVYNVYVIVYYTGIGERTDIYKQSEYFYNFPISAWYFDSPLRVHWRIRKYE